MKHGVDNFSLHSVMTSHVVAKRNSKSVSGYNSNRDVQWVGGYYFLFTNISIFKIPTFSITFITDFWNK